ncbi:MAG: polymerase [Fuyun tick rhabdovirus]|uniref:RNA-directed RNA polymerase L n=1 Tax=Fuyun tick rhabdovirus TaxID=2977134 RepID=A0A977R7S7_9RHAB|nr:MAG: polymerase [Fuyun tick rhabdovirus]
MTTPGNQSYPDTHLSSPIRSFIHQAAINQDPGVCNRFKYNKACADLKRLQDAALYMHRRPKILSADTALGQALILGVLHNSSFEITPDEKNQCAWPTILQQSLELVQLQLNALPVEARVDLSPEGVVDWFQNHAGIMAYLHGQALWEFIVYLSSSMMAGVSPNKSSPFWRRVTVIDLDQRLYNIKLDKDHSLILSKFNCLLIGPDTSSETFHEQGIYFGRDTLLMYAGLISERSCLLLSSGIAGCHSIDNLLAYPELKEILQWGDTLISYLGRDAYKVIKSYEPLVLGTMLKCHNEPYCDNSMFIDSTLEGLEDTFSSHPAVRTLTNNLITSLSHMNPHKLSQAFGLYRCWGHPSVDTAEGIKKVITLSQAPKMMDFELITKIQRKFKELLFLAFRKTHKVWPKFHLLPGGEITYLGAKLTEGHMFNRRHFRYKLCTWDYVELDKSVDIEDNFNLSTLLSDKAVSPLKSEVVESVARRKGVPFVSRRVIMAWLKSNYTTAKAFLEELQERGFTKEDLIIGVCPKEREMKMEPRLFAVMTMKVRLYFVLTEALLADHLLPLFPQVTMIDDAIKLTKKIYHATKSMGDKSLAEILIPIITNIDFEKWNLNMRAALVDPIFRVMDQFFGFKNVFEATHSIFENSTIYLSDNTIQMSVTDDGTDLADGPGVWHNHCGGFEGLRQKGWTLVTIVLLELISDSYPLKHTIMGQGDNQVIVSRLTSHHREGGKLQRLRGPQEIRRIHQSFLLTLEDTLERVGLPLKASETWSSCRLFMYGKEMYWDSMPLSMSQKRVARMFPLANELYPSLENALSTIFCNGNSAALSDISPLHAFIVGVIQAMRCIRTHMQYSPLIGRGLQELCEEDGASWSVMLTTVHVKRRLPTKIVTSFFENHSDYFPTLVLLFPKVLGGYPVQSILDFLNRGFPDPVSQWVSLLLCLARMPSCPKIIKNACLQIIWPEFSPEMNASMLLEDPVAVNALMPTNGAGVIRKQVEDWMLTTDMISNTSFKDMMRYAFKPQQEIDILLAKGAHYWPRLMHDIRDATVGGYAKSFIDKIAKTSTSMEVARSSSTTALVPKIRQAERRYFNSVAYKLIADPQEQVLPACGARHADWLRCIGWRKTSMAGVTTPHPIEVFTVTTRTELGCSECTLNPVQQNNYIAAKVSDDIRQHPNMYLTSIGESVPYLGSSTSEKVRPPAGVKLINTTPLLRRALMLLRANNWFVNPSDPLGRLLRRLVSSMTDIDPRLFETPTVSKTGSADHRYHDTALKHGGYNMTKYNAGTFLHLITTTLSRYAKGSENVTLHYQATLCYIQGVFSILMNYGVLTSHVCAYHAHLACPKCIVPVMDCEVKGDPLLDRIKFPDLSDNPMLWVPKENIPNLVVCHQYKALSDITPLQCHFGVALDLTLRCLNARDSLMYEGGDHVFPTAPIVWGMTMDSVLLLEASACILFVTFLSRGFPVTWADVDDDLIAQFFEWLVVTPSIFLLPLGIIFYDTYSRVNLSTSKYGIKTPSAAPPTNTSVAKAVLSGLQSVVLTNLYGAMIKWRGCFSVIWGSILSVFDGLILAMVSKTLFDPYPMLDREDLQELISIVRTAKAAETTEPSDAHGAVLSILLQGVERLQDAPPAVRAHRRLQVEFLNTLELSYSNASSDYLQKHYQGPSNKDLCASTPMQTLDRQSLARIPVAAHLLYQLERERDVEGVGPSRIEAETRPPANVEYYSHFYRPDPLDTTAHYKLLSILHGTGLLKRDIRYAVSGGDGTGGNTLTLMRVFPGCRVYYNTLLSFKDIVPQILGEFSPASFDGFTGWEHRLIGFSHSIEGVTDLTDPLIVPQIGAITAGHKIDLVISDMEGGGWDNPKTGTLLINNICRMTAIMDENATACVKFYASNCPLLTAAITTLGSFFQSVQIWRSEFTSSKSTECYILCHRLIPDPSEEFLMEPEFQLCSFTPSTVLTHLINDMRQRMETDLLPRTNWQTSSAYSSILKVTLHTQALERDLVVLLRRAGILVRGNALHLHQPFVSLFKYSGKLITVKAIMSSHLMRSQISDSVEADKAWHVVTAWCLVLSILQPDIDSEELALRNILSGWLVGFQTIRGTWGFVLTTEPLVKNREGYCSSKTFFQRRISSFSAFAKWTKRIMKMTAVLLRKTVLEGFMSQPVRRLSVAWGFAVQETLREQQLGVSLQGADHLLVVLPGSMAPKYDFSEVSKVPVHEWMIGASFVRL